MIRKTKRPVYNEPTPVRTRDIVPKTPRIATQRLNATVRTRLTLERRLRRVCGLAKPGPSIVANAQIRRLMLTMLDEADSPMSASLRARVAEIAGALGVTQGAPKLGRIAANEDEDLATRLGAVQSYFTLTEGRASAVLHKVLASKVWQVRACAYSQVLNGRFTSLREFALNRFKREKNAAVSAYVRRFAATALADNATTKDGD
jgi:hypothetical protein